MTSFDKANESRNRQIQQIKKPYIAVRNIRFNMFSRYFHCSIFEHQRAVLNVDDYRFIGKHLLGKQLLRQII